MWLQILGITAVLQALLRWLSHADTVAQEKKTLQMEQRCLSSSTLRAPVQVLLVGNSEDVAHNLFELLQRAECPRRYHVKVLEWPSPDEESAAVLYERSVSLRGLQDTSFAEQIQWTQWTSTKEKHGIRPLMEISHLYDVERPFTFVVFERVYLIQDWDRVIFDRMQNVRANQAQTLLCGTLSRFSRMKEVSSKRAQIEWVPLAHETHEGLPVVVPSRMLCADTLSLRNFFFELASKYPNASVDEIPWLASLGTYDFVGIVIQREMPLWTQEEVPITVPIHTSLSQRHVFGLNDTSKHVELIAKQGSFGVFQDQKNDVQYQ